MALCLLVFSTYTDNAHTWLVCHFDNTSYSNELVYVMFTGYLTHLTTIIRQ